MDPLPSSPDAAERIDVSVLVVNYNTAHLLEDMFAALYASRGTLNLQVIVVDNASRDGSLDVLRSKFPEAELIENRTNVGFGRANNQAVVRAAGRYVLLLNTDAFVTQDTLHKTLEFMDTHTRCGVLGVKLVGADGELQPSCRYFPTPWNSFAISNRIGAWLRRMFFPRMRLVDDMAWDHASVRECDWVPGAYYLIRREVVERVGLFDPRYFLYFEEVDHCRRVRAAGWNVTYFPSTQVVHVGGESAKSAGSLGADKQISVLQIESELLYFRKHHGVFGVLSAVFLTGIADAVQAVGGLRRHHSTARASDATRHFWTMVRLLGATKFATKPTR